MIAELDDEIRREAYLIWTRRGRPPDAALSCWLAAERMVRRPVQPETRREPLERLSSAMPVPVRFLHGTTAGRWMPGRWP